MNDYLICSVYNCWPLNRVLTFAVTTTEIVAQTHFIFVQAEFSKVNIPEYYLFFIDLFSS